MHGLSVTDSGSTTNEPIRNNYGICRQARDTQLNDHYTQNYEG